MEAPFGSTVEASAICLGTGGFGSAIGQDESFAVMDMYAESGGNFFDTAHVYAAWLEDGAGASERTLGAWVRARNVRDEVIIGTKGGHPPLEAMEAGRLTAAELEQDLIESLDRLGMDRVDMYWLHRDDPGCDLAEVMETLDGFVADGRVGSFGASNWPVARIEEANAWAVAHGRRGFTASQPGWCLAERDPARPPLHGMCSVDEETRAWHERTQMPLTAYTAQACGYFSGDNVAWAREDYEGPPPHGRDFDCPTSRTRLRVAAELANQKGVLSCQVALAWLLHQPFPVYPVVGTANPGRIHAAITACDITLAEHEMARLSVMAQSG